jgi:hypothetical protein
MGKGDYGLPDWRKSGNWERGESTAENTENAKIFNHGLHGWARKGGTTKYAKRGRDGLRDYGTTGLRDYGTTGLLTTDNGPLVGGRGSEVGGMGWATFSAVMTTKSAPILYAYRRLQWAMAVVPPRRGARSTRHPHRRDPPLLPDTRSPDKCRPRVARNPAN